MGLGALFTYFATAAGSLLALFNPFYGLVVYVMFAILRPDDLWSYSLPAGNYSKIVAIATIVGWGLSGGGKWNLGRAWGSVACLIGFAGWTCISFAIQGMGHPESFDQTDLTIKFVIPVLIGVTTIRQWRQLEILIWVIIGSYSFVAYEMNFSYYINGFNRILIAGHGGVDNNCAALGMVGATVMATCLVFDSHRWWVKGISMILVGLMVNTIFLSSSRGAMLSLGLGAGLVFVLIPKQTSHYVVMALLLAVGARLAGAGVVERFSTIFASEGLDASAESRVKLWQDALTVAAENPVIGVGPGLWGLQASRFGWAKGKAVHSLWCQTAAEIGFLGAGMLLASFLLPVYELWKCKRLADFHRVETPLARFWRMIASSLAAIIVGLQFVSLSNMELPYFLVLLGCCAVIVDRLDYEAAMNERHELLASETGA